MIVSLNSEHFSNKIVINQRFVASNVTVFLYPSISLPFRLLDAQKKKITQNENWLMNGLIEFVRRVVAKRLIVVKTAFAELIECRKPFISKWNVRTRVFFLYLFSFLFRVVGCILMKPVIHSSELN